jgi:hypothetical protein
MESGIPTRIAVQKSLRNIEPNVCHGKKEVLKSSSLGSTTVPDHAITSKIVVQLTNADVRKILVTHQENLAPTSSLQVISIFKGDMSFVGPRAKPPNEHEAFSTCIPFWRPSLYFVSVSLVF